MGFYCLVHREDHTRKYCCDIRHLNNKTELGGAGAEGGGRKLAVKTKIKDPLHFMKHKKNKKTKKDYRKLRIL